MNDSGHQINEGLKSHKSNPFLVNLGFISNIVVKKLKDNEEIPLHRIISVKSEKYKIKSYFPEEKIAKVYSRQTIKAKIQNGSLSSNACKVLLYIIVSISDEATSVELNKSVMIDKLGFKPNRYNEPLQELINAHIIKKKNDRLYWINPMYFFVGKREEYYAHQPLHEDLGIESAKRHAFEDDEITLGQDIIRPNKLYIQGKDGLDEIHRFSVERPKNDPDDLNTFLGGFNQMLNDVNIKVEKKLKNIGDKLSKVRKRNRESKTNTP